ncbi:MAG: flagellar basal body rod protein FlgB [Deltaproteobacteria bacterium]|nr:flagellar basal body rod protein FlgB [Deltaproteobacteria bacterium]
MNIAFFDRTITVLENALDFRAQRHRHLASNLANAETPGYKPTDIRFEDALKNAGAPPPPNPPRVPGGAWGGVPVSAAHQGHIPIQAPDSGSLITAYRATEFAGYDKNSVGVEAEMVKLSENTIMYTAIAKMLKGKFSLLMTAIKEGGR